MIHIKPGAIAISVMIVLGACTINPLPAHAEVLTRDNLPSLTFAEAVELSNIRAPELAKAQAQIDQATALKNQAKGNMLPKLHADLEGSQSTNPLNVLGMKLMQGNATFGDFGVAEFDPADPDVLFIKPTDLNDPGAYSNISSRLQLDIPVYNGGMISGYVDMADAYIGAAEKGKEYSRQKLILDMLKAYEGVRTASAYVDVAALGQQAAESYVEITRKTYREGLVSKSDLLRAEVNLGEVNLKVTEANNFLRNILQQLRVLTGRTDIEAIQINEVVTPLLPGGVLPDIRQEAVNANPGIQALGKKIQAGNAAMKVAKADYKPHFNIMLRQEWNDEHSIGGKSSYTVGGVLSWNLLDFGTRSAAVSKSAAELAQTHAELLQAQDQLAVQVDKIWYDVLFASEKVEVRVKGIGQAREAERIERLRYEQGVSTLTQLLAVQTSLDKARADYVAARYQETMQRAALLFTLGKLDLEFLETTNSTPGLSTDL